MMLHRRRHDRCELKKGKYARWVCCSNGSSMTRLIPMRLQTTCLTRWQERSDEGPQSHLSFTVAHAHHHASMPGSHAVAEGSQNLPTWLPSHPQDKVRAYHPVFSYDRFEIYRSLLLSHVFHTALYSRARRIACFTAEISG